MAMELTHVRFAHDLKDALNVIDENAYYCGAIYPDSRFVTGLRRDKTHGDSVTRDPFADGLSDFEKGWSTHLLYDRKGSILYRKLSPEPDRIPGVFDEQWILVTALKLLEDMESYQLSPASVAIINGLSYKNAPQDEDLSDLAHYLAAQHKLYKTRPDFPEYRDLFRHSVEEKTIETLIETTKRFQADPPSMAHLKSVYNTILQETLKR